MQGLGTSDICMACSLSYRSLLKCNLIKKALPPTFYYVSVTRCLKAGAESAECSLVSPDRKIVNPVVAS